MLRFVTLTRIGKEGIVRVRPDRVDAIGPAGKGRGTFVGIGERTFYVSESTEEVEQLLLGTPTEQLSRTGEEVDDE